MRFFFCQLMLVLSMSFFGMGCGGDKSKPTPGGDGTTTVDKTDTTKDVRKDLSKKDQPTGATKSPTIPKPPPDSKLNNPK